eukprot:sb/3467531/
MRRYLKSIHVMDVGYRKWLLYDQNDFQPSPSDLVYHHVTNADLFCTKEENIGSVGTVGRKCSVNSYGPDACANLCCNRGFMDKPRVVQFDCDCKFVYEHLDMRCNQCQKTIQEAFSNICGQRFREIISRPTEISQISNAVKENVEQVCKCQGLSGSCTVKTCYQRAPSMEKIGAVLMRRYLKSIHVMDVGYRKWLLYDQNDFQPSPSDLVYHHVTNADLFCTKEENIGSIGTVGRKCSVNSYGPDACANLCCNRGFMDKPRVVQFDCDCKFVYEHLDMRCNQCQKTIQEAFCM